MLYRLWLILPIAVLASAPSSAQSSVFYRLVADSEFFHEFCVGPCDCPYDAIVAPMSGAFTLTFVESGPDFDTYDLTGLSWVADVARGYGRISGDGTYRIGGAGDAMHQIQLDLIGDDGTPVTFDSGLIAVHPEYPFPQIAFTLITQPTVCNQLTLTIVAAPVACPADLNADGSADLQDLATLLAHFGQTGDVDPADGDIDDDQDVDLNDLVLFLGQFGLECT